ncbi:hypothetical protein EBT31_03280 [bacterium]|jgi:hypothetical protein|nr:hypothetical protein [bacterium]NBX49439.1 hypothetical protein [bacterium]
MKRVSTAQKIWIIFGVVCFLAVVFAVQIFLTMRQNYTSAVSHEVTERSRLFAEEVKETLQEQRQSSPDQQ